MCFEYDAMAVARESEHTARKDYACDECAGPIRKGERYVSGFYISHEWPNKPTTIRCCTRCLAVHRAVHDYELGVEHCDESEAWCPFGGLKDEIGDHHANYGLAVFDYERGDYVLPLSAHLFPAAQVVARLPNFDEDAEEDWRDAPHLPGPGPGLFDDVE